MNKKKRAKEVMTKGLDNLAKILEMEKDGKIQIYQDWQGNYKVKTVCRQRQKETVFD